MSTAPDVTLQINVSAGDLAYCDMTVPALIATHRAHVREVLIMADCCRPQSTPFVHQTSRFPVDEFAGRVAALRDICSRWLKDGLVDRVEYLEPDPAALRALNTKYVDPATAWSHDHLGHAYSAYFAGWERSRGRYVLHFDADIFLHQRPGYSWIPPAVDALHHDAGLLAVSPRISPPPGCGADMVTVDAPGSGWLRHWVLEPVERGWRSDWFSTRCHLIDTQRLAAILPLQAAHKGFSRRMARTVNEWLFPLYRHAIWSAPVPASGARRQLHRAARRIARDVIPPFPLPPEVLLHASAQAAGLSCLYLGDERVWYIHPDTKPATFTPLVPSLLDHVHRGQCPASQRGVSGIQFAAWGARDFADLAQEMPHG